MQGRAERDARAFSVVIVWTLAVGGFLAAVTAMSPPSQAGTCDQVGGVITGDWTITDAQVCSGILYTVDGTININSGGSLTLIDGGLSFAKDTSHTGYSVNVNAGGELVLDNSTVTTQTDAISPYLKLAFTIAGANSRLTMKNGATLKFPGWFNATSASLNLTGSRITGFTDSEISDLGLDTEDNNDAPMMVWSGTTASVYRSTIERIYENSSGNSANIDLIASSNLYAYDSTIGVDYASNALTPGRHNELRVDGTSNAYLYNVTIDRTQDPASRADWQPAFRPTAAGGTVNLLRWAHDTVVDSSDIPIAGATIWSTVSPSNTTAQYPDNGLTTTPSSRTLWYLGRQASGANAWNRTNADGIATIPLFTDQITTATLPNAESFGNYQQVATYSGSTSAGDVSFDPYPAVSEAENNQALTLSFVDLQVCPTGVTTWSFDRQIVGEVSVATCLEISGDVTITDGGLYVDQGSDGKSRAYVKILFGGSLTLVGSSVWSNFWLPFYVANGGALVTSAGSALNLSARGVSGLLREDGPTSSVSITDTRVDGSLTLFGGSATLNRVTILGPGLWIDTATRTDLWDADLEGVASLAISTDDGDANTVDVDIRNTTFDPLQTSQLVFGGVQSVQLTSVQTYDPDGTWWETMVTDDSRVARYWWLTVNAVDGTGTLLAEANVGITVQRMDPNTLLAFTVPDPQPGDIYYTASTTWPVSAPLGFVVYRAFSELRTVSTRTVNNSYLAQGTAVIEGTTYEPDAPGSSLVVSDTVLGLTFSSLTPDLSLTTLTVSGGNGASQLQPINTDITITVTVRNIGQINVRNVTVSFFEDNVDRNLDGIMDFSPLDYRATGLWIGDIVIPLVPKNATAIGSLVWHPLGALESSRTVSAVVDPPVFAVDDGGVVRETDEANNILPRTFTLYTWPDLAISSADIQFTTEPVVNNDVAVRVTVHNIGTNRATGATIEIWEGALRVGGPVMFDITPGVDAVVTVTWRPGSVGAHVLTFATKIPSGLDIRNRDYVLGNNNATFSVGVLTPPDLVLQQSDYGTIQDVTQNQAFTITVILYNVGQTTAVNVSVAAFLGGIEIGRSNGLTIGATLTTPLNVSGIAATGLQAVQLRVDPDNRINEGGAANESNNVVTVTVNVEPPEGTVILLSPAAGQTLEPGKDFAVTGYVRDQNANGISGVGLTITLRSGAGTIVSNTTVSQIDGFFFGTLSVPAGLTDGAYDIVITPSSGLIQPYTQAVTVKSNLPFLSQPVPLLGIPYWLLFVILAAAAGVVIGVTVYWKVYGLGKMVECGECGAFIPEDATTCPKCGVEFEKDMAKCSNCQAWIPVDVKQCPECGVEFATGQVEMADYEEKMRAQYDEVVRRIKDDASRQLGRSLSDREFQDWWRKQPTFVTFEDWLREEEEMRKMGSKPCPVCGTLNSVTATVCHKCGSLMREGRPPGGGGVAVSPPVAKKPAEATPAPPGAAAPSAPQPAASTPPTTAPVAGTEPLPRRVIRKPIAPQPLVQKKIIKKPAESQDGQTSQGESSTEKSSEDEY